MGKKSKKAAAKRAATKPKTDDGKSCSAGGQRAKVCIGSTSHERHRQRKVEESEFFRVASLFGIQGERPDPIEFKHPEASWPHQKLPEELDNPIYNALWESTIEGYRIYDSWRRVSQRRGVESPMCWQEACRIMRVNALSRLRHRRKQRKYRDRKIKREEDTKQTQNGKQKQHEQ